MLGRIYDILKNKDLTVHQKAVNIWLITNSAKDFPKLPPEICPCIITLKNGKKHQAYIDTNLNGKNWIDGKNWIEYGIIFTERRQWTQEEVETWELI